MPTPQSTIQKSVDKARRSWLRFTIAEEHKLARILNESGAMVQARINDFSRKGVIPPERLLTLLGSPTNPNPDSIRGMIRALRPKLNQHTRFGMRTSINMGMQSQIEALDGIVPTAKLMIGSSFIGVDGKLRMYDVRKQTFPNSRWGKINGRAMDALIRTQHGAQTISNRVWDITHDAENLIRNRLNTGILLGDGAAEIARDSRAYLKEPNNVFRRIRKDGFLVLSEPAKRFRPGRGIYRSSYQNALRFARTEAVRAYHEGIVRYGLEKDFIKGWISRIGSDNPAAYDLSVNGKFFPKESPPNIPYHPNGMCHAELVLSEIPDSELTPAPSQAQWEAGNKTPTLANSGGVKRAVTIG